MYLLRRAAVGSFASPLKARTFVTKASSGLRQSQKWQVPVFQKRFASEEASPAQEKTSGETVPTEPTKTEQAMKQEASESQSDAVTSEAQAEKEPNVVEKSVPEAADATQSTAQQVAEKAKETVAGVRNAAESILGESARGQARGTHAEPKPSRILYIGNLFFEVKSHDLEREFSKYGTITNARVAEDARGLSRGFGFVEFETIQDAEKAQKELNQKALAGRNMAVQFHVRREARNLTKAQSVNKPSKTLFIGNMSFQMSDKDLNDLFRQITNVTDVRVAVDRRSGQPRGFCHADFIDVESAQKAKEILEKKEIYGRRLRIDYSRSTTRTAQE